MIETNNYYVNDNLELLQSLPDNSIDLVYLDPPYNTSKDWINEDGVGFTDKFDSLESFVEFISIRVKEIHRILKDTGSMYLHIDPNTSHYLKVESDKIFGRKQFRNEIIWSYTKWSNSSKHYQKKS